MDDKTEKRMQNFIGKDNKRSLAEAISEVDRELQVRRRCYSRWIDDGKMTEVDAIDRFDRLASASAILHELDDNEPES